MLVSSAVFYLVSEILLYVVVISRYLSSCQLGKNVYRKFFLKDELAITPLHTQFASYIHLQDQDFIETENNYINDKLVSNQLNIFTLM